MGTRQPTPMTRQAAERIAAAATRDPPPAAAAGAGPTAGRRR
jgi:hypothetical protein